MIRVVTTSLLCLLMSSVAFGQSVFPSSGPLGPTEQRFAPIEQGPRPFTANPDTASGFQWTAGTDPSASAPGSSPTATLTGEPNAPAGGASAGAQNNGTNPAAPASSFVVNNEYFHLRGGDNINTVYTRFKYPWFGGKGGVTLEIPYVYYDLSGTIPNTPRIGGLGDISINTSYNVWHSDDKKLTIVGLFNTYLPTADNLLLARPLPEASLAAFNLGTGKYVLASGVAAVYAFAPNFFIAPVYLFEGSAFGVADRPDIRRGKFRLFAMYAWESGVYVLPEFQALTSYRNGSTDCYLAPELGYTVKGTTLLVKPGFGLGTKTGEREWGLTFGAKINY